MYMHTYKLIQYIYIYIYIYINKSLYVCIDITIET